MSDQAQDWTAAREAVRKVHQSIDEFERAVKGEQPANKSFEEMLGRIFGKAKPE